MSKSATADFDAAAEWTSDAVGVIPVAAQHEVVHCRPGIVTKHEGPGAIPGFFLLGMRKTGSGRISGIRDQQ
jgi:hypothetical protein